MLNMSKKNVVGMTAVKKISRYGVAPTSAGRHI